MYTTNEILFPPSVIPDLNKLRGPAWRALVERVAALPETHPESLAFSLMMIRLDGCMECETDSFRAMKGCLACARQTVRRTRRTDAELLALYRAALNDVVGFLEVEAPGRRLAA